MNPKISYRVTINKTKANVLEPGYDTETLYLSKNTRQKIRSLIAL